MSEIQSPESQDQPPEHAEPHERRLDLKLHGKECPECDYVAESMDHLVDHITDVHGLFQWVTRGRPVNE